MRPEADGMMLVRAELCERLASLQTAARRLSQRDFTESVSGISGSPRPRPHSVVRVADRSSGQWLRIAAAARARSISAVSRMRSARRMEESAAEAMLASVSVRLCG